MTKSTINNGDSGLTVRTAINANFTELYSGVFAATTTVAAAQTLLGLSSGAYAAAYSLPTASPSVLGGVKVDGSTITINGSGIISASGGSSYTLPPASTSTLGGVMVDGVTVTVNGSGVISATSTGGGIALLPAVGSSIFRTAANSLNNVTVKYIVNQNAYTGSGVGGENYNNEVVGWGWNLSNTIGVPATAGTPCVWDGMEFKYNIAGKYMHERHMESVDTFGVRHRWFSFNVPHDGTTGSSHGIWCDAIVWADFAASANRVQWDILNNVSTFGSTSTAFQFKFLKNNTPPFLQYNGTNSSFLALPYYDNNNNLILSGPILWGGASPTGGTTTVEFNYSGGPTTGTTLFGISQSTYGAGTLYGLTINQNGDYCIQQIFNSKSNGQQKIQIKSSGSSGIQSVEFLDGSGNGWGSGRRSDGDFEIGPYYVGYGYAIKIGFTNNNAQFAKPPKLPVYTVSTLPSASTYGVGSKAFVTDATVTTYASIVVGSGANAVPVYSDGTNWRIG